MAKLVMITGAISIGVLRSRGFSCTSCCHLKRLHSNYVTARRTDMNSKRIRNLFLDYFVNQHSHKFVPSSPVLPHGDPTLLFTSAGMNQFKSLFLGVDNIPSSLANLQRAANSQKCVRVGGKHNDMDDVGRDGYHHTFFEMLGSWSFGDYFKEAACELAWKLITEVYGISPKSLFVTYFGGDLDMGLKADEECKEIWLRIGVPKDHILPFGMRDNFWDMGETGPCGPCTEIHYCHLNPNANVAQQVNRGNPDVIEMWNIVFIQYNRQADGRLSLLPKFHVDTGMGLERLTAVLQGSTSNYDTDLFVPLFNAIQKESGCPRYCGRFGTDDSKGLDTAYRILADHARMCTISIADGLLPDEIGAGHCLRKVIRRGVQISRKTLNSSGGLLEKIVPYVVESLEEAYPELSCSSSRVVEVIHQEEEMFVKQIEKGLKLFQGMVKKLSNGIFPATNMWELYFVHGIPEEIIFEMIAGSGMIPETDGFQEKKLQQKEFQEQRQLLSRHNSTSLDFTEIQVHSLRDRRIPTTEDSHKYTVVLSSSGEFLEVQSITSDILAIWDGQNFISDAVPEEEVCLITKETNFYSEAGGQDADIGFITTENGGCFEVKKVTCIMGYVIHRGKLLSGSMKVKDRVIMAVDRDHREGCTRNHTATHLLNAALGSVIGRTMQKSSHVTSDYLRFDFSTKNTLTKEQILAIEQFARDIIEKHCYVKKVTKHLVDAVKYPNVNLLPGEVYTDVVRVVAILPSCDADLSQAVSLELCCGTHLDNTSSIQDFVIFSQKPQAQSVRSIHAITGPQALKAKELVNELDQDICHLSAEISEAECRVSKGEFMSMAAFDHTLSSRRAIVAEGKVPLVSRDGLDKKIELLQRRVTKMTRINVKNEIRELVKNSGDSRFIVHVLKSDGNEKTVFTEAMKALPKVPSLICLKYKDAISGRCLVPKEMLTPNFNAEKWSLEILKSCQGHGKSSKNDPNLDFMFRIMEADAVPIIQQVAYRFANDNL